jgi:hypothetical protein
MAHVHNPPEPVQTNRNSTRGMSQVQLKFELDLKKNCAEILKNHNFQTVRPKITNDISLESLEHVESISALIVHRFSTQFESIFKLR